MKKVAIIILGLVACTVHAQNPPNIWTVDNNPGAVTGENRFTGTKAFQNAINSPKVKAGDIIHVTRSSINHGNITINKKLTIYGIGLNPDTDKGTRSSVSIINITDSKASGSVISGLQIVHINFKGHNTNVNKLLIENCSIASGILQEFGNNSNVSNCIIRNNVIGRGSTRAGRINLQPGKHSSVVISNNVIYQFTDRFVYSSIIASNGTIVSNNIFIGAINKVDTFSRLTDSKVVNNIFYYTNPSCVSCTSNEYKNNLAFGVGNTFSTANNNTSQNNITGKDPLFKNIGDRGKINFTTFDPSLKDGSPAKGSGTNGTDMGVFGGSSPMDLKGSSIPIIQSLEVPTNVAKGKDLKVRIKAKGN